MFFKFKLEPDQIKEIDFHLKLAEIQFKKKRAGALICQIGKIKNNPDEVWVQGAFMENPEAEHIKEIVEQYFSPIMSEDSESES